MNRRALRRLAAVGTLLALLLPSQAEAQEQKQWTWKDREGKIRTGAELEGILAKHDLWLGSGQSRGTRANLRGANLSGANLDSRNLGGANLSRAELTDATLSEVNLNGADLNGANLIRANLTGAHLVDANLTDAKLIAVNLNGADLIRANLTGASLFNASLMDADLTGANLIRANLTGAHSLTGAKFLGTELKDANFLSADLQGATFEPKSTPEIRSIARGDHLELLTYGNNPDALVQLRKQFQENGFREQERKITYALRRLEAERAWIACKSWRIAAAADWNKPILWSSDSVVANCGTFILNRVFFDWTCQYGMNPGRALQIWLALLLFCWLVYAVFIHVSGASGIYRVQKTDGPTAKEDVEEQIRPRTISSRPVWRYPLRLLHQELRVFFWAGFFSLMSAFNIGFRDINFGRWLRLLPRTEYDLKAKGWARTVAGFQSLISVYLIALWVLTYFGRPFE